MRFIQEQVDDVEKAVEMAKEHYKQVKKDHKQHRKEHLESRAKYNVDHNDAPDIGKEIDAIRHIEEQIRVAQKIGYVLKSRQYDANSGILILDIGEYTLEQRSRPDFDHTDVHTISDRMEVKNGKDIGRWERVTQKTKVKEMLIEWQCRHFTQSCNTPFVAEEWSESIMSEDIQNKILDGTFSPPESLHPLAKTYLEYLKRPPCITDELLFEIKVNDFYSFIAKGKERTSCSPSGRTYVHYKTLLRHS